MKSLKLANGHNRESAAGDIEKQIVVGKELLNRPILSRDALDNLDNDVSRWQDYNKTLLWKIFNDQRIIDEYGLSGGIWVVQERSLSQDTEDSRDGIRSSINRLSSLLERLDLYDEAKPPQAVLEAVAESGQTSPIANPNCRKVFVVHGHDTEKRLSVEKLLKKLDLEPIVLQDQPGGSETLIELLEKHDEVAAAVVIFTPDDIGKTVKDPEFEPRARQNVIFELGYFIAKLGRESVFTILGGGMALPSDFKGVRYTKMDDGDGWQVTTARNLKNSGLEIDLNKLA